MRMIEIETTRDARNRGLVSFIYGEQHPDTAIIFCHGFPGCSSGVLLPEMAERLSRDYLVCRFDFRGHGKSKGKFHDSSIGLFLKDLDYVVGHVRRQYSPIPEYWHQFRIR